MKPEPLTQGDQVSATVVEIYRGQGTAYAIWETAGKQILFLTLGMCSEIVAKELTAGDTLEHLDVTDVTEFQGIAVNCVLASALRFGRKEMGDEDDEEAKPCDPATFQTKLVVKNRDGLSQTPVHQAPTGETIRCWVSGEEVVLVVGRREGARDMIEIPEKLQTGEEKYSLHGWISIYDVVILDTQTETEKESEFEDQGPVTAERAEEQLIQQAKEARDAVCSERPKCIAVQIWENPPFYCDLQFWRESMTPGVNWKSLQKKAKGRTRQRLFKVRQGTGGLMSFEERSFSTHNKRNAGNRRRQRRAKVRRLREQGWWFCPLLLQTEMELRREEQLAQTSMAESAHAKREREANSSSSDST